MALARGKLGLLACAEERAICDFGSIVRTILVALGVRGEVEKRYRKRKSDKAREIYAVIRNCCAHAALVGVWAHVTLTQRSRTPTGAVSPVTVWKKFDFIIAFLRRFSAAPL